MITSRFLPATVFLMAVMALHHHHPPIAHAALPASPTGNTFHHEIDALYNDTHHTEVLPNGTTYVHHHYHFVHPETGRHVTKNVTGILATHKYTFVTLNDTVVQSAFSKEFLAATVDDDDIDDANGNNDTTHITITLHPGDEYFVATSALLRVLETHTEDKPVVILGAEYLDHKGRHLQHRILRWSIQNISTAGSTTIVVKMDTYKMEYHQLFQHLRLNYEASHLPHSHTAPPSPGFSATPPQQIAKRTMSQQSSLFGWIADAISNTTSAAVDAAAGYAATALDAAVTASGAIAQLSTGEVAWQQSDFSIGTYVFNREKSNVVEKATTNWNVMGDIYIATSAQMDSKISFVLMITNYNLQVVSVDVDATMWAEIWTRTTAELLYNKDDRALLATITMTPVTFAIAAVPIVIRPSVPIYGGYSVRIQASLVVEVIASGKGAMSMGFTYTPDQSGNTPGSFVSRASQDIKFTPTVSKTGDISAQLYFEAFIEVNPYVQVNFIGGPYISFRAGAEAIVLSGSAAPTCGFSVDVNVVPLISVGAKLDISVGSLSLIEKTFAPKVVYNNKYSLLAYCYSPPPTPAPGVAYVFSSDDDGAVYSGSIKGDYSCKDTQNISVQILKADSTSMYTIAYISTLESTGIVFTQQTYYITLDSPTAVTIGPTPNLNTNYGGPSSSFNFPPFPGGKTADGMRFSVPSSTLCSTVYLNRVVRSGGALPAVPTSATTTTTTTTTPTTTTTTTPTTTTTTPATTTTTTTPVTTTTTTTTTATPPTTVVIKTTSSITDIQAESFIYTFRANNPQNSVNGIDAVFSSVAVATSAIETLHAAYPTAKATRSGTTVAVFGLNGFNTTALREIVTYVYSSGVDGIVSGVTVSYASQSDASAMMSSVNAGGQAGFASASKQEPEAPPSADDSSSSSPVGAIVGAIVAVAVVGGGVIGGVVYWKFFKSKENTEYNSDTNEVMLHDMVDL